MNIITVYFKTTMEYVPIWNYCSYVDVGGCFIMPINAPIKKQKSRENNKMPKTLKE